MDDVIKLAIPVRPFSLGKVVTDIPVRKILDLAEENDRRSFSLLLDRVYKRNERYNKLVSLNAPEVVLKNEQRLIVSAVEALLDNSNCDESIDGNCIKTSLARYGYTIDGDEIVAMP